MKINNLEEVLKYAQIDALPQKNNDVPFKYAIGTVKTTAVEEAYCILKMIDNKPEVKKMFCGGMILQILDAFPYDFGELEQPITNEIKTSLIKENAPLIAKSTEVLKPIISDELKKEIKTKNKAAIDEKAKEEASWLINGVETFEQAKDWAKSNFGFITRCAKPFMLMIKDEAKFKTHFREVAQKYLLENK